MKQSLIMGAASAGRGLRVLVTSAMLFAALAVTGAGIAPSAASTANSAGQDGAASVFYTTSGAGAGLKNGAEIFAITVRGTTVTTRDVGSTHGGDCGSLALSPHGTLYSMCAPMLVLDCRYVVGPNGKFCAMWPNSSSTGGGPTSGCVQPAPAISNGLPYAFDTSLK